MHTTYSNNGAHTPALVTGLERGAHRVDVADALKREVSAAVGELDEYLRSRAPVRVDGGGGGKRGQ